MKFTTTILHFSYSILSIKKRLVLLFILIILFLSVKSQEQVKWKLNYKNGIDWFFLTEPGIFLLNNKDGLHAIDPNTEKEIWNLENYKNIPEGSIQNFKNTPYVEILGFDPFDETGGVAKQFIGAYKGIGKNIGNIGKKGKEVERSIIIDPVTGNIIFDSKKADLDYVNEKEFLPAINCFLLEGYKKKDQVFALYDIEKRKTLWVKQKETQVKKFSLAGLLTDNTITPFVDNGGNIIVKYLNSTFRINKESGDYMWQRPSDSLYKFVFTNNKNYFFATGGSFIAKVNLESGIIEKKIVPKEFAESLRDTTLTSSNLNLFLKGITIFPLTDGLLASYSNGFNLLNYADLTPRWSNNIIIPDFITKNIRKVEDGQWVVFIRNTQNNNDGFTLMDSTGKILWDKPYIIDGNRINMFESTGEGILCVSDKSADYIDWTSGRSKMSNPLHFISYRLMIAHSKENKSVGIFTENKLFELNYGKLTSKEILSKIEFRGKDSIDLLPSLFEVKKNGYFLSATQNLMMIDFNGNIVYNKYYEKPVWSEKSRTKLAALAGLTAGFVFNTQAQQLTNAMYGVGLISTPNYMTLNYYDDYYNGSASAFLVGGLTSYAFSRQQERNQIFKRGRSFQLVFSKLATGGTGFIKIEKETGNELSSIRLDDKQPTILMDDALSGMYYISKNSEDLSFYSLK